MANAFIPRRYHGRILYRDAAGEQGREDFDIDVRAGDRTIRAYCEMEEGALTRDASWTLDRDHRPVEGHVRVVQHGALTGSTWYRFDEFEAECVSLTQNGRQSARIGGRFDYLGLHPLVGDGMIALARGTDRPGEEVAVSSITCSYDVNGETDLGALPISIGVAYVGEETVTVPAGTFAAHHYLLNWQPQWPPADLWVHGEDAVFLRLNWSFSGLDCVLTHLASLDGRRSPRFD